jgi:Carboxypeptidase regulatory-like domain/TonB dependent receptor
MFAPKGLTRRLLALFLFLMIATLPAMSQFSSAIEGTVADTSRAGVPSADVLLVNLDTQVTQRVVTSDNGFFRVSQLPPGSYRLEVRKAGFKTWAQTDLVLAGSDVRTVYPVLAVGEQAATVEVTAISNAVETGTSNVSRSVEEKTISEVPMVGRNAYSAIVALAPGVTGSGALFGSGSANALDSFQAEPAFQVNAAGQRQEQNEYQVDGTSVNGNSRDGISNLTPEPDTIQEIRVSANSFSAEKGRNSGALIEVFTKSGSNQYHGTLSEFHTDNYLSARTVFQTSIPASRRNEYGFTFGGPVIKNKTFIFGSYYGLSTSTNSTSVVREETPEFASFVKTTFPNSLAAKFFTLDPPAAYPNTSINTVAQVRQSNPGSFPSTIFPSDLPAVGTATITQPVPQPSRQWNIRGDQNLRGYNDRLYVNWYRPSQDGTVTSTRPNLTYPYATTNAFGRVSWTHTFKPNLLNEAAFSVVRAGGNYPPAPGDAGNLPNVNITGISTGFNQAGYYRFQHNNYIIHDGLTWIRGSHQIKVGVDIDRQQGYAVQSNNARPTFGFSNILDFAQDLPFSQSGPTIDIAKGDTAINLYRKLYALYTGVYIQDDWKLSKRITVNAGLRWDYFGHWATGHQGIIPFPIFTPGPGTTFAQQVASGTMVVRGDGYFANNTPNGFAPRIAVAWDVFGNGSTSIRAGYGMFHSRVANLAYGTNGSNTNPPAFGSPSLNLQTPGVVFGYGLGSSGGYYFPPPPGFSFQTNSSGGIVGSRVSVGGMDPNPNQPTTQDYTFSIQRRLGRQFVVEADYLGSHSYHLYTQSDVNRFAGNLVATNGSLTRLNPNFGPVVYGQTIGTSKANIFSFVASRRFAQRWSAQAIFTVGRALDADSSNDNGVPNGRSILDIANINGQFGRADYDISRRLTFDAVYEIPAPFQSNVWKAVLGGWRLSTIAIFQTGLPFSVYTTASYPSGDYNADGYNYDFPNTPAFGNTLSTSRSDFIHGLFKTSDFPLPPKGKEGDLGRNTYEGPGLANVNLNAIKSFRIPWFVNKEGATMEIRGEIFNLFNRVNLTQPTTDLSSGLFGKSTGQRQPRAVQFAIRIAF